MGLRASWTTRNFIKRRAPKHYYESTTIGGFREPHCFWGEVAGSGGGGGAWSTARFVGSGGGGAACCATRLAGPGDGGAACPAERFAGSCGGGGACSPEFCLIEGSPIPPSP